MVGSVLWSSMFSGGGDSGGGEVDGLNIDTAVVVH